MATDAVDQDDFTALELAEKSDDLRFDVYQTANHPFKQSSCDSEDTYVPVNFIPDAVIAMIQKWETSELRKQDCMDVSDPTGINRVASAEDLMLRPEDYEPIRILREVAPPKRFYRTFWRTVTHKLLQREEESESVFDRASTL